MEDDQIPVVNKLMDVREGRVKELLDEVLKVAFLERSENAGDGVFRCFKQLATRFRFERGTYAFLFDGEVREEPTEIFKFIVYLIDRIGIKPPLFEGSFLCRSHVPTPVFCFEF